MKLTRIRARGAALAFAAAALCIGLSSTGLAQNVSSSVARDRQVQFSVKLSFRTATPNIGLHITRDPGNVDRIKGGVAFEEQTNAAGNFSVPLADGTYRLRINADQLQGVINGIARRDRSIRPNSTVVVLRFSPQIKVTAPGQQPIAPSTYVVSNSPQEFALTIPAGGGAVSGQLGLYDVQFESGAAAPQPVRGASPCGNRGENAMRVDHADRLFGNYSGIMTPDANGPTAPTTQRIKFDLPRGSFGGDAAMAPGGTQSQRAIKVNTPQNLSFRAAKWINLSANLGSRRAGNGVVVAPLRGMVVDAKGMPVAGLALAIITEGTGEQRLVTSAADGSFLIPALPRGNYGLAVAERLDGTPAIIDARPASNSSDLVIVAANPEAPQARAYQAPRSIRFGFRFLF